MGFLKRLAFYLGLVFGLIAVAGVGTVLLTYLFTGKFPTVQSAEGKTEVALMTADEVAALVREQVDKAKAARAKEGEGEENDDEA